MDDLIYNQLTAAVARRGGGFPVVKCQVFRDILDTIFTGEDANVAIQMPDLPVTAD